MGCQGPAGPGPAGRSECLGLRRGGQSGTGTASECAAVTAATVRVCAAGRCQCREVTGHGHAAAGHAGGPARAVHVGSLSAQPEPQPASEAARGPASRGPGLPVCLSKFSIISHIKKGVFIFLHICHILQYENLGGSYSAYSPTLHWHILHIVHIIRTIQPTVHIMTYS